MANKKKKHNDNTLVDNQTYHYAKYESKNNFLINERKRIVRNNSIETMEDSLSSSVSNVSSSSEEDEQLKNEYNGCIIHNGIEHTNHIQSFSSVPPNPPNHQINELITRDEVLVYSDFPESITEVFSNYSDNEIPRYTKEVPFDDHNYDEGYYQNIESAPRRMCNTMSNERLDHHQSIPVRYPLPNIPSGPSNLQRLPKSFYSPRPMVEDCATYNGSRSYDGLPTIPEDDIDFVGYYNDILPSVGRRRYFKRPHPPSSTFNHETNPIQHQYFEDELVTYHRSPVSLESGYTPQFNDNIFPTFICDTNSDNYIRNDSASDSSYANKKTHQMVQKQKQPWKHSLISFFLKILYYIVYVVFRLIFCVAYYTCILCVIFLCITLMVTAITLLHHNYFHQEYQDLSHHINITESQISRFDSIPLPAINTSFVDANVDLTSYPTIASMFSIKEFLSKDLESSCIQSKNYPFTGGDEQPMCQNPMEMKNLENNFIKSWHRFHDKKTCSIIEPKRQTSTSITYQLLSIFRQQIFSGLFNGKSKPKNSARKFLTERLFEALINRRCDMSEKAMYEDSGHEFELNIHKVREQKGKQKEKGEEVLSNNSQNDTDIPNDSSQIPQAQHKNNREIDSTKQEIKSNPSFKEWTQMTLEEEQKLKPASNILTNTQNENNSIKSSQPTVSSKGMKKNFASIDCGAKIIYSSSDSQGSENILTQTRDEYMLNICNGHKIEFVVELCETIKGYKVQMGNFELYSSNFKDVKISFATHYYHQDKEASENHQWKSFGEYVAEETKELQTFSNEVGVFGKYVKVEVSSYYGQEHFCPISVFKVYGVSELELVGEEDGEKRMDAILEASEDTSKTDEDTHKLSPPEKMVKFLKEKVDETIERVIGVFQTQNDISWMGNMSLIQDVICPLCDQERYNEVHFLMSAEYSQLIASLSNPSIRFALAVQICSSYGFDNVKRSYYGTCLSLQVIEFFKILFGTNRIIALCNIIASESIIDVKLGRKQIQDSLGFTNHPNGIELHNFDFQGILLSDSYVSSVKNLRNDSLKKKNKEQIQLIDKPAVVPIENGIPNAILEDGKIVSDDHTKLVTNIHTEENTRMEKNNEMNESSTIRNAVLNETEIDGKSKSPPLTSNYIQDYEKETQNSLKQGNDVHDHNDITQHQDIQKESVWLRLFEKVKNLEKNVSMSGEYLEQLSLRYKTQIEDLEKSLKEIDNQLRMEQAQHESEQAEIKELEGQIKHLNNVTKRLELQMKDLNVSKIYRQSLYICGKVVLAFIGLLLLHFIYSTIVSIKRGILKNRSKNVSDKNRVSLSNDTIHETSSNKTIKRLLPLKEYPDKPIKINYMRSKSCNDQPITENNFYGQTSSNKNYMQSNRQNEYQCHTEKHHISNSGPKENEISSSQSSVVVKPVINVFLNNCISNKNETSFSGL